MDLTFVTALVSWRGPAPFVFAPAPEDAADEIADVAARLTYGWGAIPATVRLTALDGGEGTDSGGDAADAPPEDAGIAYTTSLFPREGTYFVPVKVAVQRAAGVGVGDRVRIDLHLELRR
ncbi:DUF1905 domain-containing protein [Brachybacterium phenoliresistens]|uniref:DUF1905 domain-containing protein n=1 Tax=Brachybacterium phenoliresistens TaxID=396014 RepID=UPI0031E37016